MSSSAEVLGMVGSCYWQLLAALLALVLIVLAIVYPERSVGCKARPELPGPKGWPIIGNLLEVLSHRKDTLHFLMRMEELHGHLFTITVLGWGRTIFINYPEWVTHANKNDIVKYGKGDMWLRMFRSFPGPTSPFSTEGSAWKTARKVMHPAFTLQTFKTHAAHAMGETMPVLRDFLRNAAHQQLPVDWNILMGRLGLVLFARMALDTDPGCLTDDPGCLSRSEPLIDAYQTLNSISGLRLLNPFWPVTDKIDGKERQFRKAKRLVLAQINDVIAERRRAPELMTHKTGRADFLTCLLSNPEVKTDGQIHDALMATVFASREEFQALMCWALYELDRNPHWMERMRSEAQTLLSEGQVPDYSSLSKFNVHMAVFTETLRLWPGIPKNGRVALQDDVLPAIPEIGVEPFRIHKGDYVAWIDVSLMKSERIWGPTARSFDPGRYLDDKGKFQQPSRERFHAFGIGPRICQGRELAAYEFVTVWAGILPYFDVQRASKEPKAHEEALTLMMKGSLATRIVERD